MKYKIYQRTKSAMQSGKKNTKQWLMAPIEDVKTRDINPLMGWTSSDDTQTQLKFFFNSQEEAVAYAQNEGLEFIVEEAKKSSLKKKSYAENFTN